MPDAIAILAGMKAVCEAAKAIPADARADWDGSNHYEIQSAKSGEFWWLICRDVFDQKTGDPSATESGQRLGMVLDYACAARTGWPATIRALEVAEAFARECYAMGDGPLCDAAADVGGKIQAILEGRDDVS